MYTPRMLETALTWSAIVLGVATAGLGLKAASIEIRDDLDEFINDMQRQGRWVRWTAIAALLTAAASAVKEALF